MGERQVIREKMKCRVKEENMMITISKKMMFAGVGLLVMGILFLKSGCEFPIIDPCAGDDEVIKTVRYRVHEHGIRQPFENQELEAWRTEILELERIFRNVNRDESIIMGADEVPSPMENDDTQTYTLLEYVYMKDGFAIKQYQTLLDIDENEDPLYVYSKTSTATTNQTEDVYEMWVIILDDVPQLADGVSLIRRNIWYRIIGEINCIEPTSETIPLRIEAQVLRDILEADNETIPPELEIEEQDVPAPRDAIDRCSFCLYLKKENYVVVDYYGDLYSDECGDCGVRIESETIYNNGSVTDIVRGWYYRY